ncbi:hypothetical protein ACVWZA_002355 [Sphingomonas sp. UYAg733]
MFEIAGGILIAVAVLVALPFILRGAIWAVAVGIGLAAVAAAYFFLSSVIGSGWTIATLFSALCVWIGWNELPEGEKNFRGFITAVLMIPGAILALGIVAVGLGFFILVTCAIIALPMLVFGPIGLMVGAIVFVGLLFGFQRRCDRRRSEGKSAVPSDIAARVTFGAHWPGPKFGIYPVRAFGRARRKIPRS